MRYGFVTLGKYFERNPELVEILGESGEFYIIRAFTRTRLPGYDRWLKANESTTISKQFVVIRPTFERPGASQS